MSYVAREASRQNAYPHPTMMEEQYDERSTGTLRPERP